MSRIMKKCVCLLASAAVAVSTAFTVAPALAYADGASQKVNSGWKEIICVVDKIEGGAGLGDSYGWKIYTAVEIADGVVTDVVTTARGNNMPSIPETEAPYFEPAHYLAEEAIVDAKVAATKPEAIDDIDVVSNATSTVHWIKEATKEALTKWNSDRRSAAGDAIDAIAALKDSANLETAVQSAQKAYDALTDAQKAYVTSAEVVLMNAAKAAAPAAKAITALPSSAKASDEAAVKAARALFNALPEEAKSLIPALASKLAKAEQDVAADKANTGDSLSSCTVTVAKASQTYTGKALKPSVTVKTKSGKTLKANTDYTVAYTNNTNAGKATVTVTGKGSYAGTKTATFTITPAAQPMTAKAKSPSVKAGKSVAASKAYTVKNAQGKLTYKKASGNKNIKVNTKNGKITVGKGLKAKTYPVKVKITAKGNANYKSGSKTVTVKVKVK